MPHRPNLRCSKVIWEEEAPINSLDLLDALASLVIVNTSQMVSGIGLLSGKRR
jgi:hypothetical protein